MRFIILIFFIACTKKVENKLDENIISYVQKVDTGNIFEYENSEKTWEIEADKIVDLNNIYVVKNFKIKFYDNGQVSAILTADSGIMEKSTKNMKAFGNVVFLSSDSSFLKTGRLYWQDAYRKIHTDDSVYIYDAKNKRELWGIGFESDDRFKNIRILKNVRGRGEGKVIK
ncbi:MAG: LPS export ABC transporter periplasmic protein LptC [candidate division WOR-3 bacterium]|nr:LPS export ABC transporter periplasmic protein LptC [candidate division WOR-3 bacterium]MCX7948073.1 LPS export ABC transporter periplasmic protein LptC [candidate division WOR-3 bacterium]MDW8150989.1 LPS export ABC transporter periplasmic protein LptC [candidate division WOR-3 bacterium]